MDIPKQTRQDTLNFANISIQIVSKTFLRNINTKKFKIDGPFDHETYAQEIKRCSHEQRRTRNIVLRLAGLVKEADSILFWGLVLGKNPATEL
eukprot:10506872-Ditylum_brightwellii.AAC.1